MIQVDNGKMAEVPTRTISPEELDKTPVGKALLKLRERMKYIRDKFDDLPEKVKADLYLTLCVDPEKEDKTNKSKSELAAEVRERLDFMATAPFHLKINQYEEGKAPPSPSVGIFFNAVEAKENRLSTNPERKGVISLQFDESLQNMEEKHIAKIMAHEFGHVWQEQARKVHWATRDMDFANTLGQVSTLAIASIAVIYASPVLLGTAVAAAVANEGVNYFAAVTKNMIQHQSEYEADGFADIVFPEVRWRETFKALDSRDVANWNFKDGIATRAQASLHTVYNLLTLADEHPSVTDRILASERNTGINKWVDRVQKAPESRSAVERVSESRRTGTAPDKSTAI